MKRTLPAILICGLEVSFAELLYNMRHVRHHAGRLNLMLRREIDAAPGWVCAAAD
ncbi:MAG: hypothetical protein LC795_10330 [Acidobacteria bacterium]|nr:hypothetical protein [Acidobacteriota bacterium]